MAMWLLLDSGDSLKQPGRRDDEWMWVKKSKPVCKGWVCISVSSYRKSNMTTLSEVTTWEVNKAIYKEKIRLKKTFLDRYFCEV